MRTPAPTAVPLGRDIEAARISEVIAGARGGCGAVGAAERLLATVPVAALDNFGQASVDQLHGRIAFTRPGCSDGPELMLRAATRLAGRDPQRSREWLLDALEMSLVTGRAAGVLDRILEAAPDTTAVPDLLDAVRVLAESGHRRAMPMIRRLLHGNRILWTARPALSVQLTAELWDPEMHASIVAWLLRAGRATGSPPVLQLGLALHAFYAALAGDLAGAAAATAEEETLAAGGPPVLYHRLHLAAMRGRPQEAQPLFAAARSAGQMPSNVHWAAAVLANATSDYPTALAAARRAVELGDLFLAGFALPELIEAAMRCAEPAAASSALESLTERTAASGTPTGLGVTAYSRALVTETESDFREAVTLLAGCPLMPYRARAHLLYGEWLRRQSRRRDAREQLTIAHELFAGAGLDGFARRAATELRAAGEPARGSGERLSTQELTIAKLVATGATSNEVAGRLFLSPRTVDAHLRNIFRKLGITSRRELRDQPGLDG